MFNQTKVSFRPSLLAFGILLSPTLFSLFIAGATLDSTALVLALFILVTNVSLAYQAAIRNPSRCAIVFNGQTAKLGVCGEHHHLCFEEQLWFAAHCGLIRLRSENHITYLIFVSPFTVKNRHESRRLKVHATHNQSLCIRQ